VGAEIAELEPLLRQKLLDVFLHPETAVIAAYAYKHDIASLAFREVFDI
jgi:hypothetical protein